MNRTFVIAVTLVVTAAWAAAGPSTASDVVTTTAPVAKVTLSVGTEEGQKQLLAVVTAGGAPVNDATVVFSVRRSFGNLIVGEEHTLDDGSAAAKFPDSLPGLPEGQLQVIARVKAPPTCAGAVAEATFAGGRTVAPPADPFPRAFWSHRAPLWLVGTICGLLAGVWLTYAFVVSQIIAISKGGAR